MYLLGHNNCYLGYDLYFISENVTQFVRQRDAEAFVNLYNELYPDSEDCNIISRETYDEC